ncbi:MAG: YkgJ family cysteine cluster protein [Proteobacteria bacterium]|nr:YkgJ family cysteine cluster protein [Pseudomonadota bacterium]MBU1234171.1 YkgJ family cysteine cluster protein [Pseudomonadota bacterium]MBU1417448.1 YkgJ family cysteine cluster protein [Pseudomonadota bacterium]MBU1453137.1 YkgJ family cysteine cluster protein [Pseudomonadota bacterium]
MKNTISPEICKKCGECCKNYPFVELSVNDISLLEKLTTLHFALFTNPKGKVVEEYFLQFKANGDCFFLNGKNGNYSCGVYEARPGICKKYPSQPLQKKLCYANRGKVLNNTFD